MISCMRHWPQLLGSIAGILVFSFFVLETNKCSQNLACQIVWWNNMLVSLTALFYFANSLIKLSSQNLPCQGLVWSRRRGLFHFPPGPVPLSIVEWCWICDKSFCPNFVCLLVLEFSLSVCPNCSPLIPMLPICLLCLPVKPLCGEKKLWAKPMYSNLQLKFKY